MENSFAPEGEGGKSVSSFVTSRINAARVKGGGRRERGRRDRQTDRQTETYTHTYKQCVNTEYLDNLIRKKKKIPNQFIPVQHQ